MKWLVLVGLAGLAVAILVRRRYPEMPVQQVVGDDEGEPVLPWIDPYHPWGDMVWYRALT